VFGGKASLTVNSTKGIQKEEFAHVIKATGEVESDRGDLQGESEVNRTPRVMLGRGHYNKHL